MPDIRFNDLGTLFSYIQRKALNGVCGVARVRGRHGDHLDNVRGRSVNPFANIIDACVRAHGFDDALGGGCDAFGFLDDVFEGGAEVEIALSEEAKRVRVAVNRRAAAFRLKLNVDAIYIAPLKEGFFDGFALGMVTDSAAALVTR